MKNATRKKLGKALVVLSLLVASESWAGQGWYLIVPPRSKGQYDYEAPLRKWSQFSAYDTAEQCQNGLNYWHESVKKKLEGATDAKSRAETQKYLDAIASSRCIASDDPRLK